MSTNHGAMRSTARALYATSALREHVSNTHAAIQEIQLERLALKRYATCSSLHVVEI